MTAAGPVRDMRHALGLWAALKPQDTAFTFMARGEEVTESLSFGALDRRSAALAAVLAAQIRRAEPALLIYPPGLGFVEALFACFRAGVVAVPVPSPATARAHGRIATILAAAGARTVLTTAALAADDALRQALGPDCGWIATDTVPTTAAGPQIDPASWDPEDVALVQFTSGSTAAPRGVSVSFANLMANHAMIAPVFGADPAEPSVTWLPAFHDMGLIGTILYPFQAGRSTHVMPPFAFLQKPVRWLRAISRLGATGSGGPSFAYDLCARMVTPQQREGLDLSRWTTAFCGAEPIRRAALQRFAAAFGPCGFDPAAFLPCYGLAEATLFVSGGPSGTGLRIDTAGGRRAVSCGQALSPQRLVIVGDAGTPLPDGQTGEIWVAGPHVSRGYWRDAAATATTFGARLTGASQGEFLRTGDLGYLREGELFVTGRLKDTVIVRGVKHHGTDLDDTICAVSPDLVPGAGVVFVDEGAAGVEEEGRIIAVHEVSRRAFAGLDRAALAAAATEAVIRAHGIRLDRVVLVREGRLPRTTSGKVQRYLSRRLAYAEEVSDG